MADDREKISTGPNGEPLNDTIAGTGPGIADDALAPGEELPERRRTKRWSGSPRNFTPRPPKKTHCRWRVNESRRK